MPTYADLLRDLAERIEAGKLNIQRDASILRTIAVYLDELELAEKQQAKEDRLIESMRTTHHPKP